MLSNTEGIEMSIDELKLHWRKEMENVEHIDNFSLSNLKSLAQKQTRNTRFSAVIYTGLAIITSIILVFRWFTSGADPLGLELLGLLALIVVYVFGVFLHVNALSSDMEEGWTLSDRVSREIDRAEKRLKLYQRLPAFVLLPLTFVALFRAYAEFSESAGDTSSFVAMIFNILIFSGLIGFTIWALHQEKRKKSQPLVEKLQMLREQLEEDQ